MNPLHRSLPLGVALALLGAAQTAHAVDVDATLKGEVVDGDGLPVPNAGVTLTSPDLIGGARTFVTDAEGRFRFTLLPPGDYDVKVEHPGFATWHTTGLRLDPGEVSDIEVTLPSRGVAEEIDVVAAAPAVDTENVATGVTLDAEFLRDIPTGRDYQSAITSAPGVVGGGNPNVRGSFDSSNQYYIDGVNTTDPMTNTFSMNMNWDAIDRIQVITGGMDAEYGRSMGGAVNIVTKSGGNDFEGNATVVAKSSDMILAPELEGDSNSETQSQQLTLNLGGPILKDKVWFYTSLQGDRHISTFSFDPGEIPRDTDVYPIVPRNWRSLYLFGKVTAQPTPKHRVWVQAQGDPTKIDNVEQDPYTLPSGETYQDQGGWLGSIGHQFTPNENLLVETQLYYQRSILDIGSILARDCQERDDDGFCTDDFVGTEYLGQPVTDGWFAYDADGFNSGPYAYGVRTNRERMSAQTSATAFFDLLGEHVAKVGVQGEVLKAYQHYPGLSEGLEYWAHNGDPTDLDGYEPALKYQYDSDWQANFAGTIVSWYAQDVYKPIDRLTIRPGLRFDLPTLKDDRGDVIFNRLTVAPRLGAAFDLTGDGKTSVSAYYGRFYDTGFLSISRLLQKESTGYSAYGWDAEAGDWASEPMFGTAPQFLRHDDLRNPYSDELNFGLARQVAKDFALRANFAYERSHWFWEDDETNLIWNAEGTDVIGSRNGRNEALYRLRTPEGTFVDYTSLELVAQKRFSDNWTMLGSYTWSRAVGTNSEDQATGVWDIPEQRKYERGLLAHDRTHVLKMTGSYRDEDTWRVGDVTGGWVLGWDSSFASGTPYRKVVWNDYYQGYSNYVSEGDGRYRLPMRSQVDLRAGLLFGVAETSWMLGADLFNVFNDRTITAVNTAFDEDAAGDEQTFGEVLGRQRPRNMQIVLKGEF